MHSHTSPSHREMHAHKGNNDHGQKSNSTHSLLSSTRLINYANISLIKLKVCVCVCACIAATSSLLVLCLRADMHIDTSRAQ